MALTARQVKFCAHYVKTNNGTESYIYAGFSKNGAAKSANRLLQKDEIRQEIAKRRESAAQQIDLTAAEVIEGIRRVTMKAEADESWQAAMKGFELEAKCLGLLTDSKELTGPKGGPVQVDATAIVRTGVLTTAEREELKARLARVAGA